jgi:RNA polymerase sigma-70 factor (ECF subfamily)
MLSAVFPEDDDTHLLDRIRSGDEQAFGVLVGRYHATMLALAVGYVPNRAVAEEVVQDTWVGVLRGLDGFEGRSSVRTWIFRILVNRAKTAGTRERRIRAAITDLPARQRAVVTLRDVEGLSSEEVCGVLEISEVNQRVLLHRGRSKLRQLLESDFRRA